MFSRLKLSDIRKTMMARPPLRSRASQLSRRPPLLATTIGAAAADCAHNYSYRRGEERTIS